MSFTFNGVKKDYLRVLVGLERPAWAPIEEEILEIPGRPGGIITKQHTTVRRLNIPVRVYKRGFDSLEELEEDLAAWLVTDEPKPLEFDHKPNRVYYAKVTGELIFTEYPQWADGVISFICPDPYKYGPELEAVFPTDVVTLTNEGTADADPIFELEVKEPVTMAMIQNQDNEYIMIGKPVDLENQIPVEREERVFWDELGSLVGWTTGTNAEGAIAGEVETTGYAFQPKTFGTGSYWHGPAIKTSLPEVLTDFTVEAIVEFFNGTPNNVGLLEIQLLDEDENIIAKTGLRDTRQATTDTFNVSRIGNLDVNYYLHNGPGMYPWTWSNFYGVLRIGRHGKQWFTYVAQINQSTREHHSRLYRTWNDAAGQFSHLNLAQIQIYFAQMKDYSPASMRVHDLKVYKWNPITEREIPYIAYPGDIITFDHKNADILINGESRADLKQLGASFFKLKKGENLLVVSPDDSFNVKCKYRPTYL